MLLAGDDAGTLLVAASSRLLVKTCSTPYLALLLRLHGMVLPLLATSRLLLLARRLASGLRAAAIAVVHEVQQEQQRRQGERRGRCCSTFTSSTSASIHPLIFYKRFLVRSGLEGSRRSRDLLHPSSGLLLCARRERGGGEVT